MLDMASDIAGAGLEGQEGHWARGAKPATPRHYSSLIRSILVAGRCIFTHESFPAWGLEWSGPGKGAAGRASDTW